MLFYFILKYNNKYSCIIEHNVTNSTEIISERTVLFFYKHEENYICL
jgi:hypothetical protein